MALLVVALLLSVLPTSGLTTKISDCDLVCNPETPDNRDCVLNYQLCDGVCDCAEGCADETGCVPSSTSHAVFHVLNVKFDKNSNSSSNSSSGDNILAQVKTLTRFKLVICICAIVVGLIECFAGAKLFRPTLFCAGVAGGFYMMLMLFHLIHKYRAIKIKSDAELGIQLVIGVVIGFITLKVVMLGVYMAGALGGVLLALFLRGLLVGVFHLSQTIYIVIVVAFLLVGAFLARKFFNLVLIPATAIVGSFGFWLGIDISTNTNMLTLHNIMNLHFPDKTAGWGFVSGWIVLAIIGGIVQVRLGRKGLRGSRVFSRSSSKDTSQRASLAAM